MATYHLTASFYRAGLLLGLVNGRQVVQWADGILARDPAPPSDLAELSLVAPADLTGLRRLLQPLAQRTEASSVVHGLLDVAARDLRDGRRDPGDTLTVLGQIRRFLNVSSGLQREIDTLLDDHMLAATGVSGRLEDVEVRLRAFLARFAGAEARLLEGLVYAAVVCGRSIEAASFVAALSRWVDSPPAASIVGSDEPIEVWADPSAGDDSCSLYLSPAARLAAESAFPPVPVARTIAGDELPRMAVLVLDGARNAMGRTDVERHLAHASR